MSHSHTIEIREIASKKIQVAACWTDEATPQLDTFHLENIILNHDQKVAFSSSELEALVNCLMKLLMDAEIQKNLKKRISDEST